LVAPACAPAVTKARKRSRPIPLRLRSEDVRLASAPGSIRAIPRSASLGFVHRPLGVWPSTTVAGRMRKFVRCSLRRSSTCRRRDSC
jgi:hypothetical protein